jgi:hypothetical protein
MGAPHGAHLARGLLSVMLSMSSPERRRRWPQAIDPAQDLANSARATASSASWNTT